MNIRDKRERFGYLFLALIPLVYLTFFTFKYKIDLPSADEWVDVLPFVGKYYEGTLSLNDIWEGRGGHRTFFPRIILIILARLTGWNLSYTLAAMILVAIGTFVTISYQIKMTARSINNYGMNWIIPIVSLIVFSLNQWGNWLWGLGLVYFLTVFVTVAGIVLLASPVFEWWRFRCALLLGIIATCSSSSAVGYWVSCLFILFFTSPNNMRIRRLSIILWVIAGSITIYLYTYNLPHVPPLQAVFERPLHRYVKYTVKYLGASVVPFYMGVRGAMVLAGLLGLILLGYISWVSIRFRYIKFKVIVPYISMSLYSICSAVLTALGRIPLHTRFEPATSRYMTNSSLFWISNIVFLYLLINTKNSKLKYHIKNKFKKYMWSFLLVLLVFLMVRSSVWGSLSFRKTYYMLLPAQNELLSLKDEDLSENIYYQYRDYIPILKKYHLSIFRDSAR